MDQAARTPGASRNASAVGGPMLAPGVGAVADYTHAKLADGDERLFLDVYPTHRFHQEHGYARLAACGARLPHGLVEGVEGLLPAEALALQGALRRAAR